MKKEELIEKIDAEAHLGRAYYILRVLGILMMAEVVSRDISAHRVAIGEGEDILKKLIHALTFKDWRMDRIVNDDSAGKREKTIDYDPQHYLPCSHMLP
jgi:hypothetical protein